MADGFIDGGATTALNALVAAYPWIKAHTGSPGAAGTSNAATETTRKQVTWGSPSAGSVSNSAQVQWTSVAASETWTHFTAWTAATSGTCGFSGAITANPLTAGDTITIAALSLTVSVTLAS
jgi:hypothetical protein